MTMEEYAQWAASVAAGQNPADLLAQSRRKIEGRLNS